MELSACPWCCSKRNTQPARGVVVSFALWYLQVQDTSRWIERYETHGSRSQMCAYMHMQLCRDLQRPDLDASNTEA